MTNSSWMARCRFSVVVLGGIRGNHGSVMVCWSALVWTRSGPIDTVAVLGGKARPISIKGARLSERNLAANANGSRSADENPIARR